MATAHPTHRPAAARRTAVKESTVKEVWPLRIPVSAATLEGFRAWAVSDDFPERWRISYIDNEIVIEMSPEAYTAHGAVKAEIARVICNLNKEQYQGQFFPDGTLVTNVDAELSTEPDGTFATVETLRSGRARLVPLKDHPEDSKELQGSPDWVLEILSDSSVRKDTQQLRRAYHRVGVAEYWLIDARGDDISFEILYHGPRDYTAAPRRGGWQKSRVLGRSFRLMRERNPLGLWNYQLEVK